MDHRPPGQYSASRRPHGTRPTTVGPDPESATRRWWRIAKPSAQAVFMPPWRQQVTVVEERLVHHAGEATFQGSDRLRLRITVVDTALDIDSPRAVAEPYLHRRGAVQRAVQLPVASASRLHTSGRGCLAAQPVWDWSSSHITRESWFSLTKKRSTPAVSATIFAADRGPTPGIASKVGLPFDVGAMRAVSARVWSVSRLMSTSTSRASSAINHSWVASHVRISAQTLSRSQLAGLVCTGSRGVDLVEQSADHAAADTHQVITAVKEKRKRPQCFIVPRSRKVRRLSGAI